MVGGLRRHTLAWMLAALSWGCDGTALPGESCETDDDCETSQCECGVCISGNRECTDDADCGGDFSCMGSFCGKKCGSTGECPGSMTCDSILFECTTRECGD